MTRRIALAGAVSLSAIGVGMAAAAAVERAGTWFDGVLIVACAVAVTLAAHLLPALTRRAAGWALWSVCVALTIYGHASFIASAQGRAGAARSLSVQPSAESAALAEQLRSTAARASSAVAADLAAVRSRAVSAALQLARCERDQPGRCAARQAAVQQIAQQAQALQIEADEAQRAAAIRSQLTAAAARLDSQRAGAAADPVAAGLAALTGADASAAPVITSVLSAIVVELLGALLWAQVLSPADSQPATADSAADPARKPVQTKPRPAAAADAPALIPPALRIRWPPWQRTHQPARTTTPTSTRSH